jgi:hypothetical protein
MKGRLPDFVIAGAPRSGTTSLARYLDAHPSVFVAPGKELRFFDDNYDKGIEWYSARFDSAPGDSLAGEASPWYMFDPVSLGRMATHSGRPRHRLIPRALRSLVVPLLDAS